MQKSDLEKATEKYIQAMLESEEYQRYCETKAKVKEEEELWNKLEEYRQKKYDFQANIKEEELFDRIDAFERDYREWKKDERVSAFLDAELALCRIFQQSNMRMMEAMQFE